MLMSLLGSLGLVLEQLQSLPGGNRSGFRSPKLFLQPSCQRIIYRKICTAWTVDLDDHDLLQDLVRETVSVSTLHKLHHTGRSTNILEQLKQTNLKEAKIKIHKAEFAHSGLTCLPAQRNKQPQACCFLLQGWCTLRFSQVEPCHFINTDKGMHFYEIKKYRKILQLLQQ